MITDTGKFFAGAVFGLLIFFFALPAAAFEGFDDAGGGGLPSCATCHGTLANSGPGNAAHDAHAGPANACSDCHGGRFNNPPLSRCVQCHGRAEDAGGDNVSAGIGRGLRLHHASTGAASCGSCHSDALGAVGVGENVLPSFYAQAFNGAGLDTCDGSEESFASLTISLDNDGDGLTDAEEAFYGSDPGLIDSDGDGISDGDEVYRHATDPFDPDSDWDGIIDGFELPIIAAYNQELNTNGAYYGFYTSNSILNLAGNDLLIAASNSTAYLTLQLVQTEDFVTWTNAGPPETWSLPLSADKQFYRVIVSP